MFMGVANSDSKLYDEEMQQLIAAYPDQFRLDYALSREQMVGAAAAAAAAAGPPRAPPRWITPPVPTAAAPHPASAPAEHQGRQDVHPGQGGGVRRRGEPKLGAASGHLLLRSRWHNCCCGARVQLPACAAAQAQHRVPQPGLGRSGSRLRSMDNSTPAPAAAQRLLTCSAADLALHPRRRLYSQPPAPPRPYSQVFDLMNNGAHMYFCGGLVERVCVCVCAGGGSVPLCGGLVERVGSGGSVPLCLPRCCDEALLRVPATARTNRPHPTPPAATVRPQGHDAGHLGDAGARGQVQGVSEIRGLRAHPRAKSLQTCYWLTRRLLCSLARSLSYEEWFENLKHKNQVRGWVSSAETAPFAVPPGARGGVTSPGGGTRKCSIPAALAVLYKLHGPRKLCSLRLLLAGR